MFELLCEYEYLYPCKVCINALPAFPGVAEMSPVLDGSLGVFQHKVCLV